MLITNGLTLVCAGLALLRLSSPAKPRRTAVKRSRLAILATGTIAAVLCACARTPGTAPIAPTPAVATYDAVVSPTPSLAPAHLPGTVVRITVNGKDLAQGTTAQVDGETPASIVITFPVAMDRSSIERFVPRSASIAWTDDRTLSLSIPANENDLAFKVAGATSADGLTIIDLFFVSLTLPPSIVVSTYSVEEVLAGVRSPREPAVRVSAVDAWRFSPDGRKVLMFQTAERRPTGHSPRIFDLRSHSTVTLPVPPEASGLLLFGEWAGNDRVVLVGEGVWVGAADGSAIRKLADLRGLRTPQTLAVSPLGSSVAIGWSDRLAIVGLGSGSMRTIDGHHDECANLSGARLAWSSDDARLAAVECDASAPAARVRIVDAAGRTTRTLEGGDFGVTSLLTGDFAIPRESGEQGAGSRRLFVVFSFEGIEKARFLGRAPTLSPDGRYMLDGTCCAGEGFVLTDLRAPDPSQPAFAGRAMWLTDGRVLVFQGTAGAR